MVIRYGMRETHHKNREGGGWKSMARHEKEQGRLRRVVTRHLFIGSTAEGLNKFSEGCPVHRGHRDTFLY
jgi:hypothetical protein